MNTATSLVYGLSALSVIAALYAAATASSFGLIASLLYLAAAIYAYYVHRTEPLPVTEGAE